MANQFPPAASKRRRLAACYLVKDEAGELRLSLNSIKDFADDIFIVMTEKNDEVDAAIKEFGRERSSFSRRDTSLTVCFFPWRDDFAAARNFALELVYDRAPEDPWILFLDADEFLPPERGKTCRDFWPEPTPPPSIW